MSTSTQSNTGTGIGFPGLLAIVFITLKLTGYIGWSWWWVLAPLWIGWALVGVFFLLALLLAVVAELLSKS